MDSRVAQTQEKVELLVANWLLEEVKKIFGEEEVGKITDIKGFLDEKGYSLGYKSQILLSTYTLYKGDEEISHIEINPLSLVVKTK